MVSCGFFLCLDFDFLKYCFAQNINEICIYWYYTQAAKQTGALQEAKNKLEKQVEELTWRLQLEKRMRVSVFNFFSHQISDWNF